jgi:hypothetical protein
MVDSRLFKHWVLTSKEDNGVMIYKPKDALSGNTNEVEREGFEIKPDGEFIKYELSPDRSPVRYVGKYKIQGNTLYTRFKNQYLDSLFRIVEVGDNILKII